MGFRCGIVGLPNVGKSTLFNALTSARAEAANFPFCTIEPNTGIVAMPDHRLNDIAAIFKPKKVTPTQMVFVDIAGLVRGASKGEGLGNQFLAHIREVQAIAHVVRCFENPDVVHVEGAVDPLRDVSIVDTELALADLDTAERKIQAARKAVKGGDKAAAQSLETLERVQAALAAGKPVRALALDAAETEAVRDCHLLTAKKVMYLANVDETHLADPVSNPHVRRLLEHAAEEGAEVVPICGKLEAEIAELDETDRIAYLKDFDLSEPGLHRVIRSGYKLLGLETFFTAGETEVRAWTIPIGTRAPQAAGTIHTDFERGFIRAEVYHYEDLMRLRSEAAVREAGLMRLEGKDYVVQDGDVIFFRFAV
jgi:hypothetical protein